MIIYNASMEGSQPWQITLFLAQFKDYVQNQFIFSDRHSSIDTITNLGITIKQAKDAILGLTYGDYYRGPFPHDSPRDGEYWEFGKSIQGEEVFIKLKTITEFRIAICLSFHPPEVSLEYPHKIKKNYS
ncbi:hypothetical protein ACFLV6_00840 [Chloroflexota bacterium]